MVWRRSSDIPFPSVWHRFQAKSGTSDRQAWYVVQDLPEDLFEAAVQHMTGPFSRDELMNRTLGLGQDKLAMDTVISLWREMVSQRLSLVCFEEGSSKIVGLNILAVSGKADAADEKFPSAIFQTIFDVIGYVCKSANVFDKYGVNEYLSAMGLSVEPEYRGRGIATEILRARVPLCRAVGLRLTSTCFTGPASQHAARKAGFVEDFSVEYGALAEIDKRFVFPGIEQERCSYMSLSID
ncbi:uncharacterized protein LOC129738859 [Uranotaenia lowii]|uniref:uncharacterized protein LOC129738859 n=1 Tax=Uranotaenia lowii TaxID=190385 RepID=UPI00247A3E50|nr:uncharacterized protein LOC129738859 [Uranotaenia lowii]